jgi:micrococcal nuclease
MYEYKVREVIKVVDGDTVDVVIDVGFDIYLKKRVRIAGIDTPESRTTDAAEKAKGLEAKKFAELWFAEHKGNIVVRTSIAGSTEKYGRLLGHFYSGDLCFNEMVVEAGLAWKYDGGTKDKDLSKLGE